LWGRENLQHSCARSNHIHPLCHAVFTCWASIICTSVINVFTFETWTWSKFHCLCAAVSTTVLETSRGMLYGCPTAVVLKLSQHDALCIVCVRGHSVAPFVPEMRGTLDQI
jgi:hypothetical protein